MSALYPTPSPAAMAWLVTLRTTLRKLGDEVRSAPPIDVETVAAQLKSELPEAAELGSGLDAVLAEFEPTISGLTAAFGLRPATILIALGRGEPLGELDPVVAEAMGQVPELTPLTSSGTVTIAKDGRATTLIAATTIGPPTGPLRLAWPDREDVWLCAVPASEPLATARAALARILPHVGVSRADIREGFRRAGPAGGPARPAEPPGPAAGNSENASERESQGSQTSTPRTLHAALRTIDPAADPDLVLARLEGWRTAVEQLHRGAVEIHWEQA